MMLTTDDITETLQQWLVAWNNHNLDNVLALLAPDVVFEHWTGASITGVKSLHRAWRAWFRKRNFYFELEDLFVDAQAQKAVIRWQLHTAHTPSETNGRSRVLRGVDIIHFKNGLISHKLTYSKSTEFTAGENAMAAREPQGIKA